ncbi:MAG: glutaminyl-peptide cyclotransferase, partial [Anaerolineales bacterium]|nr:glutaminyl-peptide cyclotransferase [Anaerolineales bacterium]
SNQQPTTNTPTPVVLPMATVRGDTAVQYTYRVINSYPHDPTAFTQGLVWDDGTVYEGTGLSRNYGGISTLRRVDLESGDVLQSINLPDQYFGEGIVVWDERIIQLTWQSHVGFIYDKTSFELLEEFSYPTEGWGITHDGEKLIMSDGTDTLYFWNPETLEEIGRVQVHDENGPVVRLNELEYINGEVWANVWQTDRIARIDPADGRVTGWVDLTGLLSPAQRLNHVDVLNGIMVDAGNGRLFVTGKYWPLLFEIEVEPLP